MVVARRLCLGGNRLQAAAGLASVALLFGLAIYLQKDIDRRAKKGGAVEFLYLPKSRYLRCAAIGNEGLLADLLWIKSLGYVAGRFADPAAKRLWIYEIYDAATDLDPYFREPYYIGSLLLAGLFKQPDKAVALLNKARLNMPQEYKWLTYYQMGSIYMVQLDDPASAAVCYRRAIVSPGCPDGLKDMLGRVGGNILDEAGFLDSARVHYQALYDRGGSVLREIGYQGLKRIDAKLALRRVRKMAADYRALRGRAPRDIDELRALAPGGGGGRLPEDPFGGSFSIDRKTGEVVSESLMKMKLAENVQRINAALESFRSKLGRNAVSLEELVSRGILKELPEHPFGRSYDFDPAANAVRLSGEEVLDWGEPPPGGGALSAPSVSGT